MDVVELPQSKLKKAIRKKAIYSVMIILFTILLASSSSVILLKLDVPSILVLSIPMLFIILVIFRLIGDLVLIEQDIIENMWMKRSPGG